MVRLNITLSEEIYEKLSRMAGERKKSYYISRALEERFQREEEAFLEKLLKEGYSSTRKEDNNINKEWEAITLEDWKD